MAWYLAPALATGRAEVNARWPHRDRTSDGTIGDAAHQATRSDHNPNERESVNAWDMDIGGVDPFAVIDAFERHPSAHYWIYDRLIADRDNGWVPIRYVGTNPHTQHVHFSIRQTAAAEQDRRPWGIWPLPEEDDLNAAQAKQLADLHAALINTRHTWAGGRNAVRLLEDLAYAFLYGLPGTDSTWLARTLRVLGEAAGLDATELERIRGAVGTELTTELLAALRAELSELPSEVIEAATERAVRRVLGSLDATT